MLARQLGRQAGRLAVRPTEYFLLPPYTLLPPSPLPLLPSSPLPRAPTLTPAPPLRLLCSSLAYAGTLLVRSLEELDYVRRTGPTNMLAAGGLAWGIRGTL